MNKSNLTTGKSSLNTTNSRLTTKKPGVIIIEGHVQGLANTRLLGKKGVPVIVVDKDDCVARYSRYCKAYYKCPDYLGDDFAEFLIRLHRAFDLQDWLLLPSNDHAVHTISRNKERLSKCFKVITEDMDVIEKIYNKRKLLSIAEEAGIPIPATVMPQSENPKKVSLRYPILVKGNQGLSFYKRFKHKALMLASPKELEQVWSNMLSGAEPHEYFIQEVIPYDNKTVSVTVFAVNGAIHAYWMGVKLREHPVTFGTATCCQSVFEQDMLDLSRKLIKELEYTGVCEIEWLRDSRDNTPKLIEINARTWLWVGLAAKCGVDYPNMIYEYFHRGTIPTVITYKLGTIWLNIYTDTVYSILRVLRRIDSPVTILKSYKRVTEATWDIVDPLPFVKYAQLMGRFVRSR
jgi:predicted ATP-grasp superfamily ATP-dependent carboligase